MENKLSSFLLILTLYTSACGDPATTNKKLHPLVGTWKMVYYADFDSIKGKWVNTYGDHPKGYFTYTKSGIVNINMSAENDLTLPEDSAYIDSTTLGALLDQAFGYFGTYTIDQEHGEVIHHPKGGSVSWYIGTDQHRQFKIKGDSLFLGDPNFNIGKRVLVREE